MNPIDKLKSVLLNNDGRCCIDGSEEDRAIIERSLQTLAERLTHQEQRPMHPELKAMLEWFFDKNFEKTRVTDAMVVAAARALRERQIDACGAIHSDNFEADARAMLEAAHGIKGD